MREMLIQAKTLLKQVGQELKTNSGARSTLAQAARLFQAVTEKPKEVERILTKWADVNETYRLAHKGAALRANYNRNKNVISLAFALLRLAAAFPPVAPIVAPVIKKINVAVATVKAVVPKAIAEVMPEPIIEEKVEEKAKPKRKTAKKGKKSTTKSKRGRKPKSILED